MTAFDAALAALHTDPNLSRPATYFADGAGPGVSLRLIWGEPQRQAEFGETGAIVKEIKADVRLADIACPKSNDLVVTADGAAYIVVNAIKDSENLAATLTLKPKPAT